MEEYAEANFDSGEEFVVDAVVAEKKMHSGWAYLVKWKVCLSHVLYPSQLASHSFCLRMLTLSGAHIKVFNENRSHMQDLASQCLPDHGVLPGG